MKVITLLIIIMIQNNKKKYYQVHLQWRKGSNHREMRCKVPPLNLCDLIFPRLAAPSCYDVNVTFFRSASRYFSMKESELKTSKIRECYRCGLKSAFYGTTNHIFVSIITFFVTLLCLMLINPYVISCLDCFNKDTRQCLPNNVYKSIMNYYFRSSHTLSFQSRLKS